MSSSIPNREQIEAAYRTEVWITQCTDLEKYHRNNYKITKQNLHNTILEKSKGNIGVHLKSLWDTLEWAENF